MKSQRLDCDKQELRSDYDDAPVIESAEIHSGGCAVGYRVGCAVSHTASGVLAGGEKLRMASKTEY